MPKKSEQNKAAIPLILVLAFATITIHAMFWTFNTFDPKINPVYKNLELQFGFQVMHMFLFFWMLIAVLTIFRKFYSMTSLKRIFRK